MYLEVWMVVAMFAFFAYALYKTYHAGMLEQAKFEIEVQVESILVGLEQGGVIERCEVRGKQIILPKQYEDLKAAFKELQ